MYVASQLLKAYGEGKQWRDCAVLYRMNALSNQIEMALKSNSIPYRVVGASASSSGRRSRTCCPISASSTTPMMTCACSGW